MRPAPAVGVSLLSGLAAAAWVALTLGEFGRFGPLIPLLALLAAVGGVGFLLTRGGGNAKHPAFFPEEIVAIAIACASLLLTLPADEFIIGGQDPGVYVHVAASTARTGSLTMEEPELASFSAEERDLILRNYGGIRLPFPGLWLLPDGRRIAPQFYHLFPSLMAVAFAIGGVRAALLVNPLLNVAAILALYALASLLVGRRWALAAALVQALASAQIRQAKFPTAELMTQLFLLAGVALLGLALQEDSPSPLAPLAGAALGMALLARYDALVFVVVFAFVLFWGMGPAGKTGRILAALGTTSLFGAQAWFHQQHLSPYYQPFGETVGKGMLLTSLLLAAGLLARRLSAWERIAGALRRRATAFRAAAAGLLASWVFFGWFIRPRLAGPGRVGHLFRHFAGDPPSTTFAALLSGPGSRDMLFLVDLLGAAGMIALLVGLGVLIVSRRGLWETAWLAASVALLGILTFDIFHDRFLMWASRRFVPAVIPLASIGIAAAAAWVANARGGRRPAQKVAGVALVATVLLLVAGDSRAMAHEREWPGLIAWYERMERALPDGAELFCDQPGFAAPLRFLSGHRAYELPARSPERIAKLVAMMRRRAAAGREVLYLSQQPFADPKGTGITPLGSYPLRSSILAQNRRGVPTTTTYRGADFVLYRVQPFAGGPL